MSALVPDDQIEEIAGVPRHPVWHIGRAVSAEQQVYILHSGACKAMGSDLRCCEYSLALDRGIERKPWLGREDEAVVLRFRGGLLVPGVPAADVAETGGDER